MSTTKAERKPTILTAPLRVLEPFVFPWDIKDIAEEWDAPGTRWQSHTASVDKPDREYSEDDCPYDCERDAHEYA